MGDTLIYVKTQFIGYHRWKNAPKGSLIGDRKDMVIVKDIPFFLRHTHRHVFHVKVKISVKEDDRELEFFTVQHHLNEYLSKEFEGRDFDYSCEQIAKIILSQHLMDKYGMQRQYEVDVSEDAENGAIVKY